MDTPLPVLRGERIALRVFCLRDAGFLLAAANDADYQRAAFASAVVPLAPAEIERRLREGHRSPLTGAYGGFELAVTPVNDPPSPIGVAGLYRVDRDNGNAEIGASIIAPEQRGQGLGFETHVLLIDYAFEHLGLHRVYAHVKSSNAPALALCDRLGFRVEGTLRQHRRLADGWLDLRVFGVLRDEWRPRTCPTGDGGPCVG
ncbi:GNAT family N-acetyltransferase [Solirubrobacter sp. CPCC 204708]|nr:GNAT family N-acetyltransferase [Solirubrobacter deserti]